MKRLEVMRRLKYFTLQKENIFTIQLPPKTLSSPPFFQNVVPLPPPTHTYGLLQRKSMRNKKKRKPLKQKNKEKTSPKWPALLLLLKIKMQVFPFKEKHQETKRFLSDFLQRRLSHAGSKMNASMNGTLMVILECLFF